MLVIVDGTYKAKVAKKHPLVRTRADGYSSPQREHPQHTQYPAKETLPIQQRGSFSHPADLFSIGKVLVLY